MSLVDYLDAVTAAGSVDEVWSLHTGAMNQFGFDRAIYWLTSSRAPHPPDSIEDMLVLTNHDPRYMERYVNERWHFDSPMVRWTSANTGSCSWRWIAEHQGELTARQRRAVEHDLRHGITAGYSMSFRGMPARALGGISLAARRGLSQRDVDAHWTRVGRVIEIMNRVMHLKVATLPHPGKQRLTRRQREALEWVADGKTMQDIACIMGLKTTTIEKHLRLARETLKVETTTQAVLKAAFQNQIFLLESQN